VALESWFRNDLREHGARARAQRLVDQWKDQATRVLIPGREQELASIKTEIAYFDQVVGELERMSKASEVGMFLQLWVGASKGWASQP
jgi:hypothetical protein